MRFLLLAFVVAALLVVAWLVGGSDLLRGGADAERRDSGVDRMASRPGGARPPSLVGHPSAASPDLHACGAIRGRVVQDGDGVVAAVHLRVVQGMRARGPYYDLQTHWLYESLVSADAPLASTTSGADGSFSFDGVVPGRYAVRVTGANGEQASRALDVTGHARGAFVQIELPSGPPVLQGRARYADGRPFHGFIRVHYDDAMVVNADPFRTLVEWGTGLFPTGDDGTFTIRGLPDGEVRLAALVPGRRRFVSSPVDLPHAEAYEFVVDDGCEDVTGVVLSQPGDVPVPFARVEASGDRAVHESVRRVVYTDADGRFRVRIPPYRVTFRIDAEHHASLILGDGKSDYSNVTWSDVRSRGYRGGRRTPFDLPPDRRVVLRLTRTAEVRGVVRRADDGRPVAGVPVFAVSRSGGFSEGGEGAVTDTEGRYRLADAPSGDVTLFVAGGGWMTEDLPWAGSRGDQATARLQLPPGGSATLDLEVVPTVGLRGRVRDAAGRPVVGAATRCLPSVGKPRASDFPFDRFASPAWLGTATTDAEGRFEFDTVLPSFPYQVHVLHPEHPRYVSPPLRAVEQGWTTVDVTLPPTRGIDVRVVDAATGEGIGGARVSLGSGHDVRTWITERDGTVRAEPIRTGAHAVWAKATGYAGLQRASMVDVEEEGERPAVELALAKAVWVRGRVVTPEGIAPSQVHVSPVLGGTWWALTGEDGRFRCGPVPAGPLELRAYFRLRGKSITRKVRVNAPADDVVIDVRSSVAEATQDGPTRPTWTLEVVGPEGRPVPRARCRVWGRVAWPVARSRERRLAGRTADVRDGKATLSLYAHQVPDEAWIAVWDARDPATGSAPAGAVSAQAVPVEGGAVRVVLPTGRTIEGRVAWADGAAAAGILVRAFDAATAPGQETWRDEQHGSLDLYRAHARAVCDERGVFRLEGLADVPYAIVPLLPPDARPVDVATIPAGARDVRILLERGVAPVLMVLSSDGMPVTSCSVQVIRIDVAEPRRVVRATTNGAGRARLPGLEAQGTYTVIIERPGKREDLLPSVLMDWTPRDETVVLEDAFEVSGIVDTVLVPPTNALRVHYRILGKDDARAFWRIAWAKGEPPSFRIPDLAEDDVLLMLVGNPEGRSDPRALRVAAGTTGLVLPPERAR